MKQRYTAMIVDDEPEAIASMEILLEGIEDIEVVCCATEPEKALTLFRHWKPDLLFLDIQMPALSGFEILERLYLLHYGPCVIFTTAYDKYALQAIKAGAFDYLLKPVDMDELRKTVTKAVEKCKAFNIEQRLSDLEKAVQNHRKLRFNTRSGFILIHPDEIFYIEADANYSEIFLSKENCEVVSMNIGTVEEILPKQFIRINRSVIINSHYLTKVSGVNKNCTLKKDEDEITLSVPDKQMPDLKRRFGER
ncbi:MAG TPA: LytTR family DNA-binding domain-containing protein [Bacteroidales bacterium]|nr:LytTR family DNA-binding domain-containing protein [Bacteroidales bacterium]